MMATNSIKLLTGNSHPELAKLVADRYVLNAHQKVPLKPPSLRPAAPRERPALLELELRSVSAKS
jgi:hypothetical protein